MSETKLDQIVKGAAAPEATETNVAAAVVSRENSSARVAELYESKRPASHSAAVDPLSTLPSSPPQIYLNLLILEASLRSQYLTLRARQRLHTFFLLLLACWIAIFTYLLFFRAREDGKGVGGSPYWVIDMGEKVGFMGGVLTLLLVWATGQWERGISWPRRWAATTNRGLRTMNLKIVIMRGPRWKRVLTLPTLLFPYSAFFPWQGSSYHYVELTEKRSLPGTNAKFAYRDGYQAPGMRMEDIAAGGDQVKLLLLPRPFSPEFRENWELYRAEYWERENERRAELRKVVTQRQRDLARQFGGWRWWTGWWRVSRKTRNGDVEKMQRASLSHAKREHKRHDSINRRRGSVLSDSRPHSRSSSRASTVGPDFDGPSERVHRRHKSSVSGGNKVAPLRSGLRPRTSDVTEETVDKRASMVSYASSDSERSTTSANTAKHEDNTFVKQQDGTETVDASI